MILMATIPGFFGNQTSLNPAGPAAAHIEHTFVLIFWITASVYLLTLAVLVYFVWRRRYTTGAMPQPQQTSEASDRFATRAVTAATALTVILLFVMMVSSFITSHHLGKMNKQQALTIDVYGHQWWWEVQYPNEAEPYRMVTTANEIHVPVGTPIRIHGTSRDVIHSFWAPNIQGKRDLLPGYNTDVLMQVDKPGRWRGQCAEYCGLQHAHMSFYIIGESQKNFDNWMTAQAQSSVAPNKDEFPGPTIWPFLAALATTAAFVVSVFTPWGITFGAIPIAITMIGWFWPEKQAADRRRAREIWPKE